MIKMTDFGCASEESRGAAFSSVMLDSASDKIVQNGRRYNTGPVEEADGLMVENPL